LFGGKGGHGGGFEFEGVGSSVSWAYEVWLVDAEVEALTSRTLILVEIMIELGFLGIAAVLSYAGSAYISRYEKAIRISSNQTKFGYPEAAEKNLERALSWPALRRDGNKRAICLNLLAYIKTEREKVSEASTLCQQILEMTNVANPIKGLAYYRMAEIVDTGEASSLRSHADELWDDGRTVLSKLALWESLGYLFYTTDSLVRASECFEKALETTWTEDNLYLRSLCLVGTDTPNETLIQKVEEALKYVESPLHRASLLEVLAYYSWEEKLFEKSRSAVEEGFRILKDDVHLQRLFEETDGGLLKAALSRLSVVAPLSEKITGFEEAFRELGPQQFIREVGVLHEQGEHERCAELLQPNLDSKDPLMHYAIGVNYFELGNPEAAIEYLSPVVDHFLANQFRPKPANFLARAHLALLEVDKSFEYLQVDSAMQARSIKLSIELFWNGDPPKAEEHMGCRMDDSIYLLYTGDFEGYLLQQEIDRETETSAVAKYRLARKLRDRSAALYFAGRLDEARAMYREALGLFSGSPYERAFCELWALECDAVLGEEVMDQFLVLRERLRCAFPKSAELQLDLQNSEILIHLAREDYKAVLEISAEYIAREPRAFRRAEILRARAIANAKECRPDLALADCHKIADCVPESFFAEWAEQFRDSSLGAV
jgi:tetratricopeptide (TPR) repeat protein